MTIDFNCPSCGALIHAPLKSQGKNGTCIKCQAKITVPIPQTNRPVPQRAIQPTIPAPPPGSPIQPPPFPNTPPATRIVAAPIDHSFDETKPSLQASSRSPKHGFDRKSLILQIVFGLLLAFSIIGLLGSIVGIFGGQYDYDQARVRQLFDTNAQKKMRDAQIMRVAGYVGVILCLGGIVGSFVGTRALVKRKKAEASQ